MAETKNKNWFRRHWILTGLGILILLGIVMGIMGGGSDTKSAQIVEYSLNEKVEHGDFAYTIHGIEKKSEIGEYILDSFFGEKASGVFVIVDLTVENIAKESKTLSSNSFQIKDSQDRTFDTSSAWIYLKEDVRFAFEQMQPGLPKKGKIVFDVPDNEKYTLQIRRSTFSSNYANIKLN
jgi:hypothetical protein